MADTCVAVSPYFHIVPFNSFFLIPPAASVSGGAGPLFCSYF